MAHERFLISLILAVAVHLLAFLLIDLIVRSERELLPEYSGPLFVQIEEVPVMNRSAEEAEPPAVAGGEAAFEQAPSEQAAPQQVVRERAAEQEAARREQRPAEERVSKPPEAGRAPSEPREGAEARPRAPGEDRTPEAAEEWPYPADSAERAPPPSWVAREETEPSAGEGREPAPREPSEEAGEESPLGESLDRLDQALSERGEEGAEAGAEVLPGPGGTTEISAPGEGENGPFEIQWEDPAQGREPIQTSHPKIPEWVSREGLRLKVVVSFTLTPQGILKDLEVKQASGYPEVDAAVLDALRRWKFKPVASPRNVRGRISYLITPR